MVPDLPVLNDRSLRRAVRRGILRTAAVVAGYIVIGLFVLGILFNVITNALGRESQLDQLGTAWLVGHPQFAFSRDSSGPSRWGGRAEVLDAKLLAAGPDPTVVPVRLSVNVFGVAGPSTDAPDTSASRALANMNESTTSPQRQQEIQRLRQLPPGTVASAVIHFTNPLSQAALSNWLTDAPPTVASAAALGSYLMTDSSVAPETFTNTPGVYGWSPLLNNAHGLNGSLVGTFRQWVSQFHDSDRTNLSFVGIDLDRLRTAARDGLIHGLILPSVPPDQLVRILNDPQVGAVLRFHKPCSRDRSA
jgi:hypothetical protein